MQLPEETQSTHGGRGRGTRDQGGWLSAAVLIKQRMGPGRLVYGLMIDQSIHLAQALHPYYIQQGLGGECVSVCVCSCGAMAL